MATTPETQSRRDHAVALMNHGHALMIAGGPALAEAIKAYENAINVLRTLPVAGNSGLTNSLAAALMNRGQLLHRLHGIVRATEALGTFEEGAALLKTLPPDGNPWPRRNLAGILINRANLLLDLRQFSAACTLSEEALTLSAPVAEKETVDADLTLKAYRAKCDAIGQLLVDPHVDQDALAKEASDTVDAAVALVLHWEKRGLPAFRPLLVRLFRYGAALYRCYQPQFLGEFLSETLDLFGTIAPDSAEHTELQSIARENIQQSLAQLDSTASLLHADNSRDLRRLHVWRELQTLLSSLPGLPANNSVEAQP